MNVPFRQNSWLFTTLLVGIAAAYLTLDWLPRHRAIRDMRAQVESKQQFVAQSANTSDALVQIHHAIEKTNSLIRKWEKNAPSKRDIPKLYGEINLLAKEANLLTSKFDPQPLILHESLQEIPLTLTCSGNFRQIFEFLSHLEGLPVSIWVESMRLEKLSGTQKDVNCEINMVVFSNNPQSSNYVKHSE